MSEASYASIGEEAARLFSVFEQWTSAHVATGSAECQLCPFCQVLAMARAGQPEVFDHLADASASLIAAFRAALVAQQRAWGRQRGSGVEHIDIG